MERWLQGPVPSLGAARLGTLMVLPPGKEQPRASPALAPSSLAGAQRGCGGANSWSGLDGDSREPARGRAQVQLSRRRLRAPRPQPGGRVPGLVPPLATWGSVPTTPRRVRVFSLRVVSASRVSEELKILPRAAATDGQEPRRSAQSATRGGRRNGEGRAVRAGGSGKGLEWGIRGTLQPRPRPVFSSSSEPEEPGSMDQTRLLWNHDARLLRGGSGSRGAPRSDRL